MNLELSGARVRCPNCGEIYFQTTDLYDPRKILTGEMLEWIPLYGPDGLNWSLPFAASDLSEAVICEGCGGPIAPSGYLGLNRLHFPAGVPPIDPALRLPGDSEPGMDSIAVLVETEPDEPQATIIETRETTTEEDSLTKVLTLKSCPECGGFYDLAQWEIHLATHPKDVRDRILAKPAPVTEKPPEIKAPKKSKKALAKEKEEEGPGPAFLCPMCELTFENNQAFDAHMTTHDMGSVQLSIPEK
jgi:hypothetical protein